MQGIGKLLAADEQVNHQIIDTFATVVESDLGWTEKLWTPFSRKDGTLQIDCGLGRYQNRDVMDGFAGMSRGKEQWTVRGSRELSLDPGATKVGPRSLSLLCVAMMTLNMRSKSEWGGCGFPRWRNHFGGRNCTALRCASIWRS